MSDYTKTTDFLAKDSLAVGNANKIIKGSEFEVEFDAIAAAVNTKYDSTDLGTVIQAYDATTTALAGTLTAANKIPYATAPNTAGELDLSTNTSLGTSDTTLSTQKAVKTYVDAREPVGYSQTWASATITSGTPYTNSLSKAIEISVVTGSASITTASIVVDAVTVVAITTAANTSGQMCAIVPAGATYTVTTSAGTITAAELS